MGVSISGEYAGAMASAAIVISRGISARLAVKSIVPQQRSWPKFAPEIARGWF